MGHVARPTLVLQSSGTGDRICHRLVFYLSWSQVQQIPRNQMTMGRERFLAQGCGYLCVVSVLVASIDDGEKLM